MRRAVSALISPPAHQFLNSTFVNVDSLRKKHPDHCLIYATLPQYGSIVDGNPNVDLVIDWQSWMQDVPFLERVFDLVYTPNLAIQTVAANWVKSGKGRLLAEEMAVQCGVELGDYSDIATERIDQKLPEKYVVLQPGSGKGQWEARNYLHWQEVVDNIRNLCSINVVQVGLADDPLYKGAIDLRGKTNYRQLASVILESEAFVGIDTVGMHMAAAYSVPHVALFGSSYPTSTGPAKSATKLSVLLETPDRYGCEKACYKYQCAEDKEHPCINEIKPRDVVEQVLTVLPIGDYPHVIGQSMMQYKEYRPKISGYTHVLNPTEHGFPYLESIGSMLGFCDEVVVVDGGSIDGSIEKIRALDLEKIKVYERKWDWEEPGMDGTQKAFGRAMCSGDFLWQQDADEVVHEDDYEKIRKLVLRFPSSVSLVHLPIIELWGHPQQVRTDRHSWKWRLSRNDFRITHGINRDARVVDKKNGRTYAKKGMSDGCEYVDIMTGEYIPHVGFYSQGLDNLRQSDPDAYGAEMNRIFGELPSVFHYSWCDIPRKIRNFRDFWEKCWSNLYNENEPTLRFPNVNTEEQINETANQLLQQGGEHGKAVTFKIERSNPSIMRNWFKNVKAV